MWWIVVGGGLAFVINRHLIRPALWESDIPGFLSALVYSLPNLVEAINGTVLLAGMAFWLRERSYPGLSRRTDSTLFLGVFIVAAAFTVSQELNWFNYRPDNVVDPFDIVATLVGLIMMNRLFNRFGFMEEKRPRA